MDTHHFDFFLDMLADYGVFHAVVVMFHLYLDLKNKAKKFSNELRKKRLIIAPKGSREIYKTCYNLPWLDKLRWRSYINSNTVDELLLLRNNLTEMHRETDEVLRDIESLELCEKEKIRKYLDFLYDNGPIYY
ncbi:MAG: hypothetical protein BTN85_2034 [Candidatus Methanohalarchaeum thermophilum]|uniref:Uncharacterized protein n=1 Tax=Methanohalarchaeum thermophilum TaxID=1903181 RepID=A0A1Q6DSN6_METT1|nr:MAG: hypothetical protein BTN85_2034 [Candidatus Methanohalarchaeum thermophilum]